MLHNYTALHKLCVQFWFLNYTTFTHHNKVQGPTIGNSSEFKRVNVSHMLSWFVRVYLHLYVWLWHSGDGTGGEGGIRSGRHWAGVVFGGAKYGILKIGRFWQIAICIADSDISHPLISLNTPPVLRPHPQLSVVHDLTQSSMYTKKLTLLTRVIADLL